MISALTNGSLLAYLQNIFIASTAPKLHVKIGDFGISKRIRHESGFQATTLKTRCYTDPYAAPELIIQQHRSYTSAVDIWALGCITYEILVGKTPFLDPFDLKIFCDGDIRVMEPLLSIKELEVHTVSFIMELLDPNPVTRPSVNDVQGSPWLAEKKMSQVKVKLRRTIQSLESDSQQFYSRLEALQKELEETKTNSEKQLNAAKEESQRLEASYEAKIDDMRTRHVAETEMQHTAIRKQEAKNETRLQKVLEQLRVERKSVMDYNTKKGGLEERNLGLIKENQKMTRELDELSSSSRKLHDDLREAMVTANESRTTIQVMEDTNE